MTRSGFNHTIEARNQTVGTTTYTFASWSDGGAQQHTITVPDVAPQPYTATYNAVITPALSLACASECGDTANQSVFGNERLHECAGRRKHCHAHQRCYAYGWKFWRKTRCRTAQRLYCGAQIRLRLWVSGTGFYVDARGSIRRRRGQSVTGNRSGIQPRRPVLSISAT